MTRTGSLLTATSVYLNGVYKCFSGTGEVYKYFFGSVYKYFTGGVNKYFSGGVYKYFSGSGQVYKYFSGDAGPI